MFRVPKTKVHKHALKIMDAHGGQYIAYVQTGIYTLDSFQDLTEGVLKFGPKTSTRAQRVSTLAQHGIVVATPADLEEDNVDRLAFVIFKQAFYVCVLTGATEAKFQFNYPGTQRGSAAPNNLFLSPINPNAAPVVPPAVVPIAAPIVPVVAPVVPILAPAVVPLVAPIVPILAPAVLPDIVPIAAPAVEPVVEGAFRARVNALRAVCVQKEEALSTVNAKRVSESEIILKRARRHLRIGDDVVEDVESFRAALEQDLEGDALQKARTFLHCQTCLTNAQ